MFFCWFLERFPWYDEIGGGLLLCSTSPLYQTGAGAATFKFHDIRDYPARTADDLLAFMEQVAVTYRDAKKVIVVWDNLNIHHDGRSKRWTEFNERHGGKFDFPFTPLHASWLNQVEIFFSILHRRCLKHGSFLSVEDVRDKVLAFIRRWNEKDGHAFDWCFRGYPIQSQAKAVA